MLGVTRRCQVRLVGLPLFFSRSPPVPLPRQNPPRRSRETGLLPLRQTPSRSQVELPVTMRLPLETDGLQTACHVYCCCHKRQESNNTLPQEPHGIAQGPANSCLGGPIGPTHTHLHSHAHTHTHLELTPTLTTIQTPLLPNTHTHAHLQYMPAQKRPGTHSKCPPPTCPDMLHLLQLNKHAI